MIAVDTNILVYVHREDSPWHEHAYARLSALAVSPSFAMKPPPVEKYVSSERTAPDAEKARKRMPFE